MATTEIFAIVGVVVAAAIFVPILFDENPGAFLENGLCVIFSGATNTTCNQISGNVTFVAESPISITPNFTDNTITWAFVFTGNATNQTQIHASLGGSPPDGGAVFKNETGGVPNLIFFRGLAEGAGINITERENTILIESDIAQTLCNVQTFIGVLLQNLFDCTVAGDTVTFQGLEGITIGNSSSITWELNATLNNLKDVNVTNPDEDHILIYNVTTGNFTNQPLLSITSLIDVHFNAEEATVDDIVGITCLNDVTYSFFDNTDVNEYRRQAVEFCPDSEPDDNITWLYVVPESYSTATDFKFRLFWTDDDTGAGSFVQRVPTDDDDCEEGEGPLFPGRVTCSSSDLEMHSENRVESPADWNDFIGLRWTNVIVPNGATIINATIQFEVDSTDPDVPIVVRWKGQDVDNAPAFTHGSDFDISSRTNTTAFVDWDIPDWENTSDEGPAQLTPNLATIVQEIVDRPGWLSGNAMVLKTTDWPNATGTNKGMRHAESRDGETSAAPELRIDFSTGGGGTPPVCFEISIMALANTQAMDGVFTARDTVCVNRSGTDNLSITEFTVEAVDHEFSAEDLVIIRIHRPNDFVADDFESEVFVFGGELQWLN